MNFLRYLIFLSLLGCNTVPSDDPLNADLRAEFEPDLVSLKANDDEKQFLAELRRRLQGLDKQQHESTMESPRSPDDQSATLDSSQNAQARLVGQAYAMFREQGEIPEPLLASIRNEREVALDALVRALLSDPTTPMPATTSLLRLDIPTEEYQR